MEKKKIYISIPITGHDEKLQREKADRVAMSLSRRGFKPVNPFVDVFAGKNPDYFDYLCSDLRTITDCDGICFCQGWEKSCGCGIEHDFVMRLKAYDKKDFEIFYE